MQKIVLFLLFSIYILQAKEIHYNLTIDYKTVNYTGVDVQAMTINDGIPGPTIEATEGDWVTIHVHNKMDVSTSIHWHGILFPKHNNQDGIPYLTTKPIKAHASFTFRYPLLQSGTYWYHSHTGLQEQRGVYGSIMIHPKEESHKVDKEFVVVLSDWTNEDPQEVMRTLKRGSEYYAIKKGSVQSLTGAIKNNGVSNMLTQWWNQMPGMDISDVYYDAFFINGKQSSTLDAKAGEKIRLRIINASASTYFYVQNAKNPLQIISSDGVDVAPFYHDKLLIAVAETYDALITVPENGSYELRATAQDGSGQASLFIGSGTKVAVKDIPKPNLYGMKCGASMKPSKGGMKCGASMKSPSKAIKCGGGKMNMGKATRPMSPYPKLKALEKTTLPKEKKWREVYLKLVGDMRSYIWSFNGKTISEEDKIHIKKGENIRFIFENETMMHHPMHLHGHFFRVLNKQGDFSPLKHTIDIQPLATSTIEFEANYEKDWLFHCHILYHMMSGMTRVVSYDTARTLEEKEDYTAFIDHFSQWYVWADVLALSQMNEGVIKAVNGKHRIIGYFENDWGKEYDTYLVYDNFIDRYSSWFVGGSFADREEDRNRVIVGFNYLLPLLVDAQVWVDYTGDARVSLAKEVMLTNRVGLELEYQYDSDLKSEWSTTLDYRVNKRLSVAARYHDEHRAGLGFRFFF